MYVSDYNMYLEQDAQVDKTLIEYINKLKMFNIDELLKNRKEAYKNIYDYILLARYPTFNDGKRHITNDKFEDIKNIEAKISYILREELLNEMDVVDLYNNTQLCEDIKLISKYYTMFIHRNEEYKNLLNKYYEYILLSKKLKEIERLEKRNKALENRKKLQIIECQKNEEIEREKLKREEHLQKNNMFRGKHIEINTKSIGNNNKTFISYDDKEYKFDEFLLTMYPDMRVNKSVVYFPDTINNLLKLGPTQRIKMKYDILAYHFGLPIISDEDKNDLFRFLYKHRDDDIIQKYYRRFNWDSGIEKMVAFGANLDISGKVDGPIEDFFCYEYNINKGNAVITGVDTDLQMWIKSVKTCIEYIFISFQIKSLIPNKKEIEDIKNEAKIKLYYQDKKRVALPDIQIGGPIKETIDSCIDTLCRKMEKDISVNCSDIIDKCFSTLSIPDCISKIYQFNVDFEKDVMIVDTKSAARAQQAIEQVYTIAAERLTGLKAGDKVTTKQLRDRGYTNTDGRAINTLVEYGVLKKGVLRGNYIMLKDF